MGLGRFRGCLLPVEGGHNVYLSSIQLCTHFALFLHTFHPVNSECAPKGRQQPVPSTNWMKLVATPLTLFQNERQKKFAIIKYVFLRWWKRFPGGENWNFLFVSKHHTFLKLSFWTETCVFASHIQKPMISGSKMAFSVGSYWMKFP